MFRKKTVSNTQVSRIARPKRKAHRPVINPGGKAALHAGRNLTGPGLKL